MAEKLKQRADGRYARQVVIGLKDGKPVKKTVYGKTQAEVNKKYRQLLNEKEQGVNLSLEKMTISDLLDQWYAARKEGNIKPQTAAAYRWKLAAIKSLIGSKRVKAIQEDDVLSVRSYYQLQGKDANAAALVYILKASLDYAVKKRIIPFNPCSDIHTRYTPDEKKPLSEFEIKQIEKADLTVPERLTLYLGLYAGLRIGEVFALTRQDIDLENCIISVSKTVVATQSLIQDQTKTKAGIRFVPILDPLLPVISTHLSAMPAEQESLLLTKRGTVRVNSSVHLEFARIRNKVGLDKSITFHCLRHTFITQCYWAGVPIKQLCAWVGHKDVMITLRTYTHMDTNRLMDTTAINNFYSRKSNRKSNGIIESEPLAK